MENQSIIEGLDKHLSKVNEVGEDVTAIEKLIYKYANGKSFGKLVWALIRPTIASQGGRFIAPSFNDIKQPLIGDIKDTVALMQKESDMSKQECINYLLDPNEYDDEIGNYADTSFAEALPDLYDGHSGLNVIMDHEDDMINFLNREIKKNYKMLISAVR